MSGVMVRACGMRTAIGLSAPATCAALRARLDNFAETRFISRDGDWILGAEVPLETPWRGVARLTHMLAGALQECFAAASAAPEDLPVLVCLPETDRPGRFEGLETRLWAGLREVLGHGLHPESRSYAYGQVGGVVALGDAKVHLERGASGVIVAGTDSFLVADTLRTLSRKDRLLTESNSNGFIAGEAGAAVLLTQGANGLCLRGVGFGAEAATITSGEPLRAEGMVKAMGDALGQAGLTYEDISYRISDLSGEQYYFKEAALAQARLWRGKRDPEELWHPCDGIGQTGAAIVPICLGVGLMAHRKEYAPGPVVMVHASHDDGRRAAMVLEGVG